MEAFLLFSMSALNISLPGATSDSAEIFCMYTSKIHALLN